MSEKCDKILKQLKSFSNPKGVEGMARFGISTKNAYGVSIPDVRRIAKEVGKNHSLAQQLWNSSVHEARILACMVDDVKQVTEEQMENWVKDFDSWDICDQCCSNLFDKTAFSHRKVVELAERKEEFVKRTGFVLMATLVVHDKKTDDAVFLKFLPIIKSGAIDERNFVKKAVNWALRQIGKKNKRLNKAAIETAEEIKKMDSKSAKWIAADALRELKSEAVRKRLK